MEASRLKQLRRKQLLFVNGILLATLFVAFGFIVGLKPSSSATHKGVAAIMLFSVLLDLCLMRWPRAFRFFVGPAFLQELQTYEREKIGKKQDNKARMVRIGLQLFVAVQFILRAIKETDKPMVIDDMAAFLQLYIPISLVIVLVFNITMLYRGYSIDKKDREQLGWHTLQMFVASVVLGVLLMVGGAAIIAWMRME